MVGSGDTAHELFVRDLRLEADGVLSVALAPVNGAVLPSWEPGAHIDVELPNGVERQYSLCSSVQDPLWRVAVLREAVSRGSSEYVHGQLRPGDVVRAKGPRSNFSFVEAERYIFLAGGIGITPLLGLAERALSSGAETRFAYLGTSRRRMAFLDHPVLSAAEVIATDERERLDLAEWIGPVEAGTVVYACGPESLLDALEEFSQDWPADALHVERFQARAFADGDSTTFEVECKRSDLVVQVPGERSILESLEEVGINVPSSCREGVCGTCEVDLVDGIADHRDSLLSPAEREAHTSLMVCVSRAACPRLVIDI